MSWHFPRPGAFAVSIPSYDNQDDTTTFAALQNVFLFGHVPFDIRVLGWSMGFFAERALGPGAPPRTPGTLRVELMADNAVMDGPFVLGSGDRRRNELVTPFLVPKVDATTIDGAGRIGHRWSTSGNVNIYDNFHLALEWEAVNTADVGKQFMGIGGKLLTRGANSDQLFATLAGRNTQVGDYVSGGGHLFFSPYETSNTRTVTSGYFPTAGPRISGDTFPVVAIPCAVPVTFADVILVGRDPAGFAGTYSFHLRRNGATALTVTSNNSGTRIFTPSGTTEVTCDPGDRVCWQADTGAAAINAELLWSCRVGPLATTGAGVSAGESAGAL